MAALLGGGVGAWGAGAGPLRELGFFLEWWQSQPWLGAGLGPRHWSSSSKLVPFLPSACSGGLHLGWGQCQGLRGWSCTSELAVFHPGAQDGSLCLGREQCWSQRGWSRSPVQVGGHAKAVLAGQPEQQVFTLLPLHYDWGKANLCMLCSRAESWFLIVLW